MLLLLLEVTVLSNRHSETAVSVRSSLCCRIWLEYLHQSPDVLHVAITLVKYRMLQLPQNAARERKREQKLDDGADKYELRPCCRFYPNNLNTIKYIWLVLLAVGDIY